ncbi:MAG: alkaline phosphatase family protein [Candidatus Bipolaricaulota bacterium]
MADTAQGCGRTGSDATRSAGGARPAWLPPAAVAPDYGRLCTASIPDLVSAALGLDGGRSPLVDAFDPPRVDRVLLVILDGLGQLRFDALCSADPAFPLGRLAARGTLGTVTTVFPSTTVAALASYSTGVPPLTHGLLGYRLFLREISATVNMIQFGVVGGEREAPLPAGFDVERLMACSTVYERLQDACVATHVFLPRGICDSGLSKLLYRGCETLHPCVGLSDALAASRAVLASSSGPTALTLYWPGLDSIAHARGPESPSYEAEAAMIGSAIERELVGRVGRTLLVLSSDHGFVTMDPSDYAPLGLYPELRDASRLFPTGEPRASYFHLRSGNGTALPWALPADVGEGLVLMESREAIASGLFGAGASHPESANRLGDLVLISTARRGLRHPYPDAPLLRGMHGGLSEEEMLVPLLVALL